MKTEIMKRRNNVNKLVEQSIPEFAKAVKNALHEAKKAGNDKIVIQLSQGAFATDYDPRELMLLGCAVKYAGDRGIELRIDTQLGAEYVEKEEKKK